MLKRIQNSAWTGAQTGAQIGLAAGCMASSWFLTMPAEDRKTHLIAIYQLLTPHMHPLLNPQSEYPDDSLTETSLTAGTAIGICVGPAVSGAMYGAAIGAGARLVKEANEIFLPNEANAENWNSK